MVEMAVMAGSLGVFAAGCVAWYTLWHRRLASGLERARVQSGRRPNLPPEGVVFDGRRDGGLR